MSDQENPSNRQNEDNGDETPFVLSNEVQLSIPDLAQSNTVSDDIPSNQNIEPNSNVFEIPDLAELNAQPITENAAIAKSPKPFEVAKDSITEDQPEQSNPVINTTNVLQDKQDIPDVDINSIASLLDLGVQSIKSLDSTILQKLQAVVVEVTDLKSEKLVLEVNLEQSTHLSNKRVDLFKSQLSKASKEVSTLRESNSALEAFKLQLEKRLAELETEYKSSASDSKVNQTKIDEILAEKRSTVELLEKKNRELEDYKAELSQLQTTNSGLRKELIDLETTNQTTASSLTHAKFKLQSNETQIDLLTKNNEWLNNEIKTISGDFSNYRKEKASELSTLQSNYDNKVAEFNSLKTRFENLSARFDETSNKLDNSLVEVKKLQDEKSINQEEFLKEISLKDRLVKLLTKSNDDAKVKISELEHLLENSKSDIANESGSLKTSLEKYEERIQQDEVKIQQLEATIDDLTRTNPNNDPATPVLSPAAQVAASKYPGLSLSQLYSDFSLLKKQLTRERRAKERMQHQIDAFVNELEQKAPLINATKERVEILENELTNLSIVLEATTKEKETLDKSFTELNSKLNASNTQISTLNKQRVDLARQVQSLLVQVSIRGDPQGPLTPAEKEAFNRIAKGDEVVNQSDTDRLISERLVVFQNVVDLQHKNEELLRITRELGSKLEQEEQTSRSKLESLESSAVNEAKDAIITLQEEITSIETKLNSVTRERDMFRSMLSNKSYNAQSNIFTGELSSGAQNSNDLRDKRLEDVEKELEHTKEHFKAVKVESETTITLLNQQITSLSSEKSELAINLAREKSTNTLSEERYKSLQETIKYSRSENAELRKRSELLQENLARQDQRTQQVAEELVQIKSLSESLRSESSNLKAEKQLWKSIEKRLSEENLSLIEEKSRLNNLLVNLQSLERERESNASESQKRLITQTEALEKELNNLRAKLNDGANELKDVLTRKEADSQAYQEKVDSLRNELGSYKEELVAKKMNLTQLQSQVEELTSKYHASEAKLKDLQNITTQDSSQSTLVQETLKLRDELADTKSNLEESTKNVEEFKRIAGSAEDALKSMNESFDDYKTNTGSKITKLESENKSLNEQASVLKDQIESLNSELSEQKNASVKELETTRSELDTLRGKLTDTSKLQADYDAKVAVIDSSYRQQVAIATEAQQNYEKELQKHAEVAKAVSMLREESYNLKQTIQGLSSEAKQSREELEKSRESWESQRTTLEEELRTTKNRVEDLTSQNHILYNQIESLSKKQTRTEATEVEDDNLNIDDPNNELRELITLLRREKDISDAHLGVATRDLKRVSQKLELTTTELDRSRLELAKLQSRDVDAERLEKDHEKLLEEINQLNLLRESNVTLRNELHSNNSKISILENQLKQSRSKIEPLETDVVRLTAELNQKGQELRLVIEEKDRWKQRSQDILNKYNRVDPEEHERIKEEIKTLTTKNEEISKLLEEEKTKVTDIDVKFNRVKTEAQEKLKRRGAENKAVTAQLQEAQNELKAFKELSKRETDDLSKKVKELEEKSKTSNSKANDASTKEVEKAKQELEGLRAALNQSKAELEKSKSFEAKFNELSSLRTTLESKIKSLEEEIQTLKQQTASTATTTDSAESSVGKNSEALKKLQEELSKEREELEKAKAEFQSEKEKFQSETSKSAVPSTSATNDSALKEQEERLRKQFEIDTDKKVEDALEDLRRRVREPSEAKIKSVVENRTAKIKQEWDDKLKESISKLEEEYKKKREALEKECKDKLSSAGSANGNGSPDIAKVKEQYEEEVSALKKQLAEAKKKSFDEGREATLKEVGMRTKLLQGKVEKLTKEKKQLEEKLGGNQKLPSIPGKPSFQINQKANNNNAKSAANAGTKQQGKQNQQQNNNNSNNNINKGGDSKNQPKKNEGGALKRPADQQAGAPHEKKSKNEK